MNEFYEDKNIKKACKELGAYASEHNIFAKFTYLHSTEFPIHMEIGYYDYLFCPNMIYAARRMIDLFQEQILKDHQDLTNGAARLSEEYGLEIRLLFNFGEPYNDRSSINEILHYYLSVNGGKPFIIGSDWSGLDADPDMSDVSEDDAKYYYELQKYRAMKMILKEKKYIQ